MITYDAKVRVNYKDTDQMGIVHHSNYIRYFECGRNAMLKEMDMPMEKVEASGVMMAVVAVDAKYKVPAKLGDTLRIVSIIDTPPTAKVVVKTEIYNQNEQLVCTGSVTLGFIDAMTRRPVRCPEALAEIFR